MFPKIVPSRSRPGVCRASIITAMRWDLFCRVVDNHGDVGVCWRLAADLAARGERGAAGGSTMRARWPGWRRVALPGVEVGGVGRTPLAPGPPADVVIETFGCGLPPICVAARWRPARPPVWINLEYLSAEAYVERSHGLPSPQQLGAAPVSTSWFFYPGFTPRTGGLLRDRGLPAAATAASTAAAWLRALGLDARHARRERRGQPVLLRRTPPLEACSTRSPPQPTLLLRPRAWPRGRSNAALGPGMRRGRLRAVVLPLLEQPATTDLLWSCDLNFVRGEDSWCARSWAGAPFVWQAYPQADGAHVAKLEAFLDRFLQAAPPPLGRDLGAVRAWNGWRRGPGLPATGSPGVRTARHGATGSARRPTWPRSCCDSPPRKR